ncbi:MAG: hypothetical protein E6G97_17895 [Alphaproteobacteria bacterium]|nr:MAG: hypothetical protein E6G97_17895 [Alphaproteobacteria bacterium]
MGQTANLVALPFINNWLASQGYQPGPFLPSQNLLDQEMARRYMLTQSAAQQVAGQADRERLETVMRGAFSLVQQGPLTTDQLGMVRQLSGAAMQALPTLSMMAPRTVDELFGLRGSAHLFGLGAGQASRFMVGQGGVTGLSAEAAAAMAEGVQGRLFGPGQDLSRMRGFGGASAGQMFSEMAARGLLSDPFASQGGGDLADLARAFPGGQGATRKLQANRIGDQIKDMAGALSAVRDLFGDMGRADAPIPELFAALDALTQGGTARWSKPQLEMLVRRTQQTAKLTGTSMDQVMAMQAQMASELSAAGLSRGFAPGIVNAGMQFGAAFSQLSSPFAGQGALSSREAQAMDMRLRAQAAESQLGNQLGAVMRLGDQGLLSGRALTLYNQLKVKDYSGVSIMSPAEFTDMVGGALGSRAAASLALGHTEGNRQAIERYNLQDAVRNQQGVELQGRMRAFAEGGLSSLEMFAGKRGLAAEAAQIMARESFNLSAAERIDPVKRKAFFRRKLQDALGGRAAGLNLDLLAETAWNQMEAGAVGFGPYQSLVGALSLHDREVLGRQRQVQAQADTRADIASALSPFSQGGPLRRIIDDLTRGDADFSSLGAALLGGQRLAAAPGARDALTGMAANVARATQDLEQVSREMEVLSADTSLPPDVMASRLAGLRSRFNVLKARLHEGTFGGGQSSIQLKELARHYRTTVPELLRGRRDSGGNFEAGAVNMAQALASINDLQQAYGGRPLPQRGDPEEGSSPFAAMIGEAGAAAYQAAQELGSTQASTRRRWGPFSMDLPDELFDQTTARAPRSTGQGELRIRGEVLVRQDGRGTLTGTGAFSPA